MPTSTADDRPRTAPLLTITDLAAGYESTPIVTKTSMTVGHGELVSIIGPNGAGKSTLLKAIMGIIRVFEGKLELNGVDITGYTSNHLARLGVGYVPQARDVFQGLTVLENLEMGGYLLDSREMAARKERVLAIFPPLAAMLHRNAAKLSGGERKMLAMARAMMPNASLLILDEPTANLAHNVAVKLLAEHVRSLVDAGSAVLLVEQRATAALEVSDWTYVMVSGTVALSGRPKQLTAREDFSELFLGLPANEEKAEGQAQAEPPAKVDGRTTQP